MRRFFVIVLILLFPLNVFALSMSASLTAAGDPVQEHAASMPVADLAEPGGGFDCAAACDLDPDEPPGSPDLHDILHAEAPLRSAALPGRALAPHDARRRCHSIEPPVKPPRARG